MVDSLSSAALDFAVSLEKDAGLPIARGKSAVLSKDLRSASSPRKFLVCLGGKSEHSVRLLGIDFWAAAPVKTRLKSQAQ